MAEPIGTQDFFAYDFYHFQNHFLTYSLVQSGDSHPQSVTIHIQNHSFKAQKTCASIRLTQVKTI